MLFDLVGAGLLLRSFMAMQRAQPGFVAENTLTFIPAAGDFINAELLGTPNQYMIGNVIQSRFLELNDYPTAAALSFILMGIMLIVVLVLLGLVFLVWRLRRTRRRWRFMAPGDRQWQRLALAASRAGVAQQPSETIYEYASWLEREIPQRQTDIQTIADAKVWQSYSGRSMGETMIERIERAWARMRTPMLLLAARRRLGHFFARRRSTR